MNCKKLKIGLRQYHGDNEHAICKLTIKTDTSVDYFCVIIDKIRDDKLPLNLCHLINDLNIEKEFEFVILRAETKINSKYGINVFWSWGGSYADKKLIQ